MTQRIVLIHATPLAVKPINDAFGRQWPQAEVTNLLEEALSTDRRKLAALDERFYQRIEKLVDYAESIDAAAVLFTCSAFGAAIDASATVHALPVLKPNEAMFASALALGSNIVMLATFAPAIAGMEEEFREQAQQAGSDAQLTSVLVAGARDALEQGDSARHHQLIAQAAQQYATADAIVLAHFSMAEARESVQAAVSCPVLSSPEAAVTRLQQLLSS